MKISYKNYHFSFKNVFFSLSDIEKYGAIKILTLVIMYEKNGFYRNQYWLSIKKINEIVKGV
jgi:hypothetical protein